MTPPDSDRLQNEVARHDGAELAALLACPGVEEILELRSSFGFMAFHGGMLEEMTDVIARRAAERAGASCYSVLHPEGLDVHLPDYVIETDLSRMPSGLRGQHPDNPVNRPLHGGVQLELPAPRSRQIPTIAQTGPGRPVRANSRADRRTGRCRPFLALPGGLGLSSEIRWEAGLARHSSDKAPSAAAPI